MKNIAIILRCLQLYAHNAHNLCSGTTFFADHEFLGELYPEYESQYDSVIERMIGLGQSVDLVSVQKQAANEMSNLSADYFEELERVEQLLRSLIQAEVGKVSEGTRQMLGDIADKSEMRSYKLKQRCKHENK